jgi:multiple sugar transport system substrate-binding protein
MVLAACSNNNSNSGSSSDRSGSSSGSNSGSSSGGSGGSTEVKEIVFVAAQYSDNTQPFLSQVVADFEEANPDIKVTLDVVNWNNLDQKLRTMVATGQAPDIANVASFAAFVADGLLKPLDEFMPDSLMNNFYEGFLNEAKVNGKYYGVPLLASVRALFYNKDLFAQAGISEPPKTWNELLETARTIKEKTGVDGFGVPMTTLEGQTYATYFFWGNGGDWKKDGQWVLNSPENVEALQFLSDLVRTHKVTNPEPTAINRDEMHKVFGAGKVGMMISLNALTAILRDESPNLNYGTAAIPHNDGKDPFTLGVGDVLIVFNTTKHPDAVARFFEFLYQDERYVEFMKVEGMLPVTKTGGEFLASQDETMAAFINQLSVARFLPTGEPGYMEIRLELISQVQQVLLGEKTPQQALDDLQAFAKQY